MTINPRYIVLYGINQQNVLGIFSIIRGFATLQDLAAISIPYEMESARGDRQVVGFQRHIDERHAEDIKKYLETGDNRFMPEIILSIRGKPDEVKDDQQNIIGVYKDGADDGIYINRQWKSKHSRVQRISIRKSSLHEIHSNRLIRRIDGNHRLALADQLAEEPGSPSKYVVPYSMILLEDPSDDADDYSESLIFHTINSKALPLDSEHALELILGQAQEHAMTPENEAQYDPVLYLTRLLHQKLQGLPETAKDRIGPRPLTVLGDTAREMIRIDNSIANSMDTLDGYARVLFEGLNDIVTRLPGTHPELCRAEYFLELAAHVWKKSDGANHEERVRQAIDKLESIADWLGRDGLEKLSKGKSLSGQLLDIYGILEKQIPSKVFLARWYPDQSEGDAYTKTGLRLDQIKRALADIEAETKHHLELELIDISTDTGGTAPIHPKMYTAIRTSDIILIDLSGNRPNVCIEAGYALRHHEKNRLLFLFQPMTGADKVPFDLNTFRYEPISDAAEIPGKLKPHLKAIIESVTR